MRTLVTGGAGFIGSHIVERLLREGHEVVCLDNFDPYYHPSIKYKNINEFRNIEKFELIEGDIRNKKLMKEIISDGVDYIFHNAAQAGVRISVQDPLKPNDINVNGTLNILCNSLDSGVKKIIFASSSSVYGTAVYLPFDEKHPNIPVSPYGVSKLAAEHYCRVFNEIYGLKMTSLRYFTVYGPKMRPDLAISIFTKKALNDEVIEIFGDGTYTRDFTYIDDVVEANMNVMTKGDGGIFNIGGGNRIKISELAELIINITGSSSVVKFSETVKGDAMHTWASIEKAKNELGWEPKTNIRDGIKKYIDYVKSQEN
jgi:UDP-glucose 4-epimerase